MKMTKIQFGTLILLFFNLAMCQGSVKFSDKCLTGYKILTRQPQTKQSDAQQNLQTYKLSYDCLCPNDYYGSRCSYKTSLSCFLQSVQGAEEGNVLQMGSAIDSLRFSADCEVEKIHHRDIQNIQLRQYLSEKNIDNEFGVREQFSAQNKQIIWANDSSLFDSSTGRLIFPEGYNSQSVDLKSVSSQGDNSQISDIEEGDQTPNQQESDTEGGSRSQTVQLQQEDLSPEQLQQIFIGANRKLYEKPFQYQSVFLGFGQINGNVTIQLFETDPIKGQRLLGNFTGEQFEIHNLEQYINSYSEQQSRQKEFQDLATQINEQRQEEGFNLQRLQQMLQGSSFDDAYNQNQLSSFQVPLPQIQLQGLNLSVESLSPSYQDVHMEVQLREVYQENLKHRIGVNSLSYYFEIQGSEPSFEPIKTGVIVTDTSYKTYDKIIAVLLILGALYFAYRLISGWWRKKKLKERGEGLVGEESVTTNNESIQ